MQQSNSSEWKKLTETLEFIKRIVWGLQLVSVANAAGVLVTGEKKKYDKKIKTAGFFLVIYFPLLQ